MKHSYMMTLSAAAVAAALAGAPAFAQDQQLADSVSAGMAGLNLETGVVTTLSDDQLLQIENVLNSGDDRQEQIDRIGQIVAMDGGAKAGLGVAQLQDSVSAQMADLGIDTEIVPSLSLSQLAEIENVVSSQDDREVQQLRIQQIVEGQNDGNISAMGVAQLRDTVTAEMAKLGVDTEGVGMLSLATLAEIENVVSSGGDQVEQRNRIERILAD